MKQSLVNRENDCIENAFFTAYEVQDMLGLDLNTVYTLLKNKKIPGRKVGAKWRIPQNEFYKFFEMNSSYN